MSKTVRVGERYIFVPNVMDLAMPQHYQATRGQVVRVIQMRGAPKPGTMGQVHIEDATTKKFLGMVSVHSLIPEAEASKVQFVGRVRRSDDVDRGDGRIRGNPGLNRSHPEWGDALEIRRVYLVKYTSSGNERRGSVDNHDEVVSFSMDEKVPFPYKGWEPYYSVYERRDARIPFPGELDYTLWDHIGDAEEERAKLVARGGRVKRNPDDFRHDDGGSERRRLGPGGIESGPGGTMFHGPRGVETYRLLTIRSGLRMEAMGMRITRGVSCLKLAKQVTGLKAGTAAKMLPLYEAWLRERGLLAPE